MKYKVFIFCPDDQALIQKLITVASEAGAGVMGDYTQTAFINRGQGTWLPGPNAHPHIGKVGEVSLVNEAKIEMECEAEHVTAVYEAVKAAHPYEEPGIEFFAMTDPYHS